MSTEKKPGRPAQLSAQRVLDQAVELADQTGMAKFTIRRLADALGVRPMALYHYFPSKEAIIDSMVDRVFGEIELPPSDLQWREALRIRCHSMRQVLAVHTWAGPLMESRTSPGEATLRHHDAVLGCLRRGGLPLWLVAHAYAVVDSFVYGFAMEEANLPFGGSEEIAELADQIIGSLPREKYPHLAEFTAEHVLRPGYSFAKSFEFGLDLLLDGIERARTDEPKSDR